MCDIIVNTCIFRQFPPICNICTFKILNPPCHLQFDVDFFLNKLFSCSEILMQYKTNDHSNGNWKVSKIFKMKNILPTNFFIKWWNFYHSTNTKDNSTNWHCTKFHFKSNFWFNEKSYIIHKMMLLTHILLFCDVIYLQVFLAISENFPTTNKLTQTCIFLLMNYTSRSSHWNELLFLMKMINTIENDDVFKFFFSVYNKKKEKVKIIQP